MSLKQLNIYKCQCVGNVTSGDEREPNDCWTTTTTTTTVAAVNSPNKHNQIRIKIGVTSKSSPWKFKVHLVISPRNRNFWSIRSIQLHPIRSPLASLSHTHRFSALLAFGRPVGRRSGPLSTPNGWHCQHQQQHNIRPLIYILSKH